MTVAACDEDAASLVSAEDQSCAGSVFSCEEGVPVLVVGGGIAGLVAAHAALEAGGRVTLLEQAQRCGGNAARAAGGISAAGTAAQKKRGIEDSAELFLQDLAGTQRTELAKSLCERSGGDVDWLASVLKMELEVLEKRSGHSAARTHKLQGLPLLPTLLARLQDSDRFRLVTDAHVRRLLMDGAGGCCGCAYTQDDGEVCLQGVVVLCTGGFTANHARGSLLAKHRPDLLHLPVSSRYSPGDGVAMALSVGARALDLEWVEVSPVGLVKPDDPDAGVKLAAARPLREAGAILNQEGQHVAGETDDALACAMWRSKPPFRLVLRAGSEALPLCENYAELGLMRRFRNGAALARDMGVPLATLEAEVKVDGEVWAAVVTPVLLCCHGGLDVDASGAVRDEIGVPIPGLFAAGEVAAGVTKNVEGNAPLEAVVFGRAAGTAAAALAEKGSVKECTEGEGAPSTPTATSARKLEESPMRKQDVWTQVAALQLEGLLKAKLTSKLLQAALAKAHPAGGDLGMVEELLRSAILGGEVDAGETRPTLQMSLRDLGGLPTAVATAPLPDVGGGSSEVAVSCVYCRSRLTLQVSRDVEASPKHADVKGGCAYTTLLYGGKLEYFLGALVLGWSLKNTGTKIDLLLLHSDDVPAAYLKVLERYWMLRQVEYLEGSKSLYKTYNTSRFKAVFTKLQALSCTDYAKILMMDLDMLVRGSLDELFELRAPAALKRSSGKEQPEHGGSFGGPDFWRTHRDEMCSGINAGVMLLEPDQQVYERMVAEIKDHKHPEHIGTYGPEQDYLARFYSVFCTGSWSHIHAKYNYQLMLPDDYVSSAHRALDVEKDVVVAHYSGPRVKPWKLDGQELDAASLERLLSDDSVRAHFGRDSWARSSYSSYKPQQPRERVMDGVLVKEEETPSGLPAAVQAVMWEWVEALRRCKGSLEEEGLDLLAAVREAA